MVSTSRRHEEEDFKHDALDLAPVAGYHFITYSIDFSCGYCQIWAIPNEDLSHQIVPRRIDLI